MSEGHRNFSNYPSIDVPLSREVPLQAREAGYHLVHRPVWVLLDADGEQPIFAALTLAGIKQFLDE